MYSLVALTRNRPWFVERLLGYYEGRGLRAPLLIADGSDSGPAADLASRVAKFSGRLQARHLAYGPGAPAFERLKNAVGEVRTPCVVWIGDDDFFIPARIEEAVAILEREPGVAAVLGASLQASRGKEGLAVGPYAQTARAEADPVKRLLSHLLDLHSTAYSVRRTPLTAQNLGIVAACGWGDEHFHFAELLESALTVVAGRIACLPRLTTVRETHAGQSSADRGATTGRTLFDLLVDGSWERYHGPFTRALAGALAGKPGLDAAAAERAALLALRSSIAASLGRKLGEEYLSKGLLDGLGEEARRVIERLPSRAQRGFWSRVRGKLEVWRLTRGADAAEFAAIARLLEKP